MIIDVLLRFHFGWLFISYSLYIESEKFLQDQLFVYTLKPEGSLTTQLGHYNSKEATDEKLK